MRQRKGEKRREIKDKTYLAGRHGGGIKKNKKSKKKEKHV